MVICWERGVDLHTALLMPLPLTVSCFSKIQIGFTFLVPAHPGSPGKRAVKRVCVFSFGTIGGEMTYPGIQCSPGKLLLVVAVCKTTASQLRICGSVRPLTVLSYTLLVITSVSVETGHQLPYVCVCVWLREHWWSR